MVFIILHTSDTISNHVHVFAREVNVYLFTE